MLSTDLDAAFAVLPRGDHALDVIPVMRTSDGVVRVVTAKDLLDLGPAAAFAAAFTVAFATVINGTTILWSRLVPDTERVFCPPRSRRKRIRKKARKQTWRYRTRSLPPTIYQTPVGMVCNTAAYQAIMLETAERGGPDDA